jgi:Entner-Doudoroff aldolase
LRGQGAETVELCRRAGSAGIDLVEVPVQSPDDLAVLRDAVVEGRAAGRLVGAGTVVTVELVEQAVEAGAAFTVAPGLDEEVLRASRAAGLPHLPGVATATEVHRALQLGATWLKAFPAAALGPAWFTAMRGPFPQARFVATGGVAPANAAEFLAAGAAAASLGSAFAAADPAEIGRLLARAAA